MNPLKSSRSVINACALATPLVRCERLLMVAIGSRFINERRRSARRGASFIAERHGIARHDTSARVTTRVVGDGEGGDGAGETDRRQAVL